MKHSIEQGILPEKERFAPLIRLEFLRHDEKEKAITSGGENDEFVRLTQKGRQHSVEVGKTKNPKPEVGLAYGSTRERSTEAALRQLFAEEEGMSPGDSLEDMQAKIGERLRFGKKNIVSKNLDFNWDGSREFHDVSHEHYLKSKDALVFLLEDSDALVGKLQDKESTSYSRAAANIAKLVKKYLDIFPRWEGVVAKEPQKYASHQNEMQRFLGSHQAVLEPFLMKIIEKLEGREAVNKFLETLPDKNGFGFGEGFNAEIIREEDGELAVRIGFKGQEWIATPKMIEEIIQDGDILDKEVGVTRGV